MRHAACLILLLSVAVAAQSGRQKPPKEKNAPPRPRIELPSIRVAATPQPTPPKIEKPDEDSGEEILRVESTLVPIPVSVVDGRGNAVTTLKLEDFELKINNAAQEIGDLARSETPVKMAILFDNSSSVTESREFEQKAAIKFFKKVLRPNKDQAALYSVSTVTQQILRLTGDTKTLIGAIENFPEPAGATALFDGIVMASRYLRETAIDGRRVIIIVSDGADTLSDSTLEDAIGEALKSDCQIYVVKTTDFDNFARTGRRGSNANLRDLTAERRMQQLTQETGGAVFSPLDDRELETAFSSIAAELAAQYVLSYYPSDIKRDGSFQEISLAVKTRPNLVVRARKGYYIR